MIRAGLRRLRRARRPLGLVSPTVLVARTEAARVHRHLLFHPSVGGSRAVGLLLSVIGWLRWTILDARRSVDRVMDARGRALEEHTGLDRRVIRRELLRAALRDGMPPADVVQLGLVAPEHRRARFDHVFTNELAAFHHWRDGDVDTRSARELLADKVAFATAASEAGCAVAETVAVLDPGWVLDGAAWLSHGAERLLKPVVANRARGVVRLRRDDDLVVTDLAGNRIEDLAAWHREATRERSVVQPWLTAHAVFDGIGRCAAESPTVRVITERQEGGVEPTVMYLEVPANEGYELVPVDVRTGVLGAPQRALGVGDPSVRRLHGQHLPDLGMAVDLVLRAHSLVPELYAVAWDLVPTPDGPILLEGNVGWSVIPVQRVAGPSIARGRSASRVRP